MSGNSIRKSKKGANKVRINSKADALN